MLICTFEGPNLLIFLPISWYLMRMYIYIYYIDFSHPAGFLAFSKGKTQPFDFLCDDLACFVIIWRRQLSCIFVAVALNVISTNYGTQSCNIYPNIKKNPGQEFYIYSNQGLPFMIYIHPNTIGWRSIPIKWQTTGSDRRTHDVTSSACDIEKLWSGIPTLSNSGPNHCNFHVHSCGVSICSRLANLNIIPTS